jgi:hypothetical protein
MKVFENTKRNIFLTSWISLHQAESNNTNNANITSHQTEIKTQSNHSHFKWNLLYPLRTWLDTLKVSDRKFAHRLCKLIPSQCPFERDVKLFGKVLFHIPPMCKLNPLYEEVVGLRFRALCYLADECGEDISQYC